MTYREWRNSKYWLLSLFRAMVGRVREKKSNGNKTILDQLLATVDVANGHNYALLLLWASQANAVPVS